VTANPSPRIVAESQQGGADPEQVVAPGRAPEFGQRRDGPGAADVGQGERGPAVPRPDIRDRQLLGLDAFVADQVRQLGDVGEHGVDRVPAPRTAVVESPQEPLKGGRPLRHARTVACLTFL
jgi:hypothetical protein